MDVPRWDHGHQRILNAHAVPARRCWTEAPWPPGPVPVVARIIWEVDGIELTKTCALAWTRRFVLVRIDSQRWPYNAAWLGPDDVSRGAPPAVPAGAGGELF